MSDQPIDQRIQRITNALAGKLDPPEPESVLAEADRLVNGDRQQTYGDATESFARIAALWSAILPQPVNAKTVADMLILMKVSRAQHSDRRDNYVDIAGYAQLAQTIQEAGQ